MSNKIKENIDYYIDEQSGLLVLTAHFHLERGFCCGNKCRHCPYCPQHLKGNKSTNLKDNIKKPR